MEKYNHKVSIIIPVFNREKLIQRAIDSVFLQDYANIEIIVVDDCSTDNTGNAIKNYSDPRIKYIKNENNLGAAKSRNIGINCSTGEFISFLDSDDEWLPGKLISELRLLEDNPDCAAASFGQFFINEKNKKYLRKKILLKSSPLTGSIIYQEDVLRGKSLSTNDFTARREMLCKIMGFDESLPARQDWDIWIRMTGISPVVQSPIKKTNKYILHGEQISTDTDKKISGTVAILNKYKNLFSTDQAAGFRIYLIIIVLFITIKDAAKAKLYIKGSIKNTEDKRKKLFLKSMLLIINIFGDCGTSFLSLIFRIVNPHSYLMLKSY